MGLSTLGRILYNIGSNFVVHTAVTRHALLGVFLSWGIFTGQVEHHEVAWNQKAVNIGPHLMAGTVKKLSLSIEAAVWSIPVCTSCLALLSYGREEASEKHNPLPCVAAMR